MIKAQYKKLLSTLVFLTMICILFFKTNAIFLGYGNINARMIYLDKEFKHTDVLFLGTSQTRFGINPAILWRDAGIASFNYATNGQTLPVSYYYLVEALKYADLKLVVIDIESIGRNEELRSYMKYNTIHMRPSANKIEMINELSPGHLGDYLIPFYSAHNRWKTLRRYHFSSVPYTDSFNDEQYHLIKGFHPLSRINPVNFQTAITSNESTPPIDRSEEYLNKIIQLTQDRNIELLFIELPDVTWEYEIPFKNYFFSNYLDKNHFLQIDPMEIGLDGQKDMSDAKHANIYGSQVISDYVCQYLTEHYELEDHRNQENYASWDVCLNSYYETLERIEVLS